MPDPETGDYEGSVPEPNIAAAGDAVGPYRLRYRLGQGGMGEVWAAEQSEPVHRQVAVKLIKSGQDSAPMMARFGIERQALALMDHPNIAKVLDAGATPAGKPYFVMELVKGVPITRYCDNEKLSPRERLELFIPVCQAVQHAHQKGIIHRDLKPSNILVGLYDGKPVPKVIDFGVAKATGFRLTADSVYTEVGAIVGTLEYMAPEQAAVDTLDIDTRADVYSLGVVLYELLAGSPPFSRKKLLGAALEEMLRLIRVVEPVKPSTKLSSAEDLPSLAAVRRYEPKRLTNLLRGDLDWITMKCLEKQRARRYDSVSGLAQDLRRYLDDEPVLAGPPSKMYLLKKFVRRNRGPVIASALLLLSLIVGFAGTAWGLVKAEQAHKAEIEARHRAVENADRAEANLDAAIKSTTKLVEVTEKALPQLRSSELLRRDLIVASSETARLMAQQRPDAPGVRRWAAQFIRHDANIHRLLDDTVAAERSYRIIIDQLRGDTNNADRLAESLRDYAVLLTRTGRLNEALAHFQESSAIAERLHAAEPSRAGYQRSIATTGIDCSLAEYSLGKYDRACAAADRSITLFRTLVADDAVAIPYDHQLLPAALMVRAMAERERSGYAAAQPIIKEARELIRTAIDRRAFGANSDDAYCVQAMIEFEASRIWLRNQKQDLKAKAQENLDVVVKQFTELVRRHGDIPVYRGWLAKALLARGEIRAARGQVAEARTDFDDARGRLEKLATDQPSIPEYRADLGRTYLGLSLLEPVDAALRRKAVAALQAAAIAAPDDVETQASLKKANETQ